MNATLKQARSFGIGTAISLGVAMGVGFICVKLSGTPTQPDERQMFPLAYWPMAFILFVSMLMAGVTACLFIAGLFEHLLGRGQKTAEPQHGADPSQPLSLP